MNLYVDVVSGVPESIETTLVGFFILFLYWSKTNRIMGVLGDGKKNFVKFF